MKIQIDSITVVDDHLDGDNHLDDGLTGEREITITQGEASVLLNSDNIEQLRLIIERKFDQLSCCKVIET